MSLTFKQMNRGDILLLKDASSAKTHFGIAMAQSILTHSVKHSSSSNITHAGIYDGAGGVLEASGAAGLRNAKLFSKHMGLVYQVYRLKGWMGDNISDMAATWAERLVAAKELDESSSKPSGFGQYDMNGIGGLFRSSAKGKKAKSHVKKLLEDPYEARGFYCSNFVCECYELATDGKSPINVDYNQVSPKRLQGELRKDDWTNVGDYVIGG